MFLNRLNKPKKVLLLGSGALKIGEAGEFDYSGSQAIKALKEEGVKVVLLNPNVATVQTSEGMADEIYFLPVNADTAEEIIKKEKTDGIMIAFGGQTALNAGLALYDRGALERNGVKVYGTPIEAVRNTEDRELFAKKMLEIGVKIARSKAACSPGEVRDAVKEIGLPVILRGAFALGGLGSSIVKTEEQLEKILPNLFSQVSQILVEESLEGWKEIEYEVVADAGGACITVCNMENLDPLGVHTGDSIVVAPSQTLNNAEYYMLREIALKTIRHLGIIGECNIQYALDPQSEDYRVIEVNARLSRSSALASKATGYPLAYVAAKLALGFSLTELPNEITRKTSAFFEPALDYCVVKVPRWDLEKFSGVETTIGSSMKSVGEAMGIGRDFAEALQKALRMVSIGVEGLEGDAMRSVDLREAISVANPYRIFAIANALRRGFDEKEICELSRIDRWFVSQIKRVVDLERKIEASPWPLDKEFLLELKKTGFSDAQIAGIAGKTADEVRGLRREFGVRPVRRQIDTLAAEYAAQTNYLYLSYDGTIDEAIDGKDKKVLILGSGVYRIGSSVEFDWCCVNAVQTAKELGFDVVLLNCNPETVSTDYDVCDKLIFDEISLETVLEIVEIEKPWGVIISVGGQAPNNLAMKLAKNGVKILGTQAEMIDAAEDRHKFSSLCDAAGIDQPVWMEYKGEGDLALAREKIGYPALVRPSYVLSGAAMRVVNDETQLRNFLARAALVSPDYPVVISRYETGAKEIEIDAVADDGKIAAWAISEHVENAGVHSGDATLVLPPQRLYLETVRRIKAVAKLLAEKLRISGPFNIQFLARDNHIKVIECNLRASRSLPFVSKTTKVNYVKLATKIMLGERVEPGENRALDLDYVAVKAAQFSFLRLPGADPTLGVEMASTGEAACFGDDLHEALLKSLLSTGFKIPQKGVLVAVGPDREKKDFADLVKALYDLGLDVYATPGTAKALREAGRQCKTVFKLSENKSPSTIDVIVNRDVDMVVNIPKGGNESERIDGFAIRRTAVDRGAPLITNIQLAKAIIKALECGADKRLQTKPWSAY